MVGGATKVAPTRAFALASFALIIVAIALLPARAGAASGWQIVLDRPTPNFGAVDFVSDSEGWMPAGAGLLHTTDGGATWTEALQVEAIDVGFADVQHGWVVGFNATIFYTSDGGGTWHRQASGLSDGTSSSYYIQDVEAVSPSEAWAIALYDTSDTPHFVDSVVLHTTDAGATWLIADMPPGSQFHEVQFIGRTGWLLGALCGNNCRFAGSSVLLHTTDGGATWSLAWSLDQDVPEGASTMEFIDGQHGWIATSSCNGGDCSPSARTNTIQRTEDGGQTWTATNVSQYGLVQDLTFSDASTGWATVLACNDRWGDCSNSVLVTTDWGQSWSVLSTTSLARYQFQLRIDSHDGDLLLTGDSLAQRSTDNGATWQEMITPALTLTEIDFVDGDTGFAFYGSELLRTDDAGRSWRDLGVEFAPFVTEFRSDAKYRFFSTTTGVVAHESCQASCQLQVSRTVDGGSSWTVVATYPSDEVLPVMKVDIGTGGAGIIVGANGLVVTTDYGATWMLRGVPPANGYLMIDAGVADATHLWASSYPAPDGPSALLESSDAGKTWHEVYRGVPLGDIKFFDAKHGWARFDEEYLSTSDGGRTWDTISIPTRDRVYEVSFVDPANGWASIHSDCENLCGYALLHTANGGKTWAPQPFDAPDDAVAIGFDFVDAQTGWFTTAPAQLFGNGGNPPRRTVIYHTTDGGGGPIGEVPPDFPGVGGRERSDDGGFALPVLFGAAGVTALAASFALRRRRG